MKRPSGTSPFLKTSVSHRAAAACFAIARRAVCSAWPPAPVHPSGIPRPAVLGLTRLGTACQGPGSGRGGHPRVGCCLGRRLVLPTQPASRTLAPVCCIVKPATIRPPCLTTFRNARTGLVRQTELGNAWTVRKNGRVARCVLKSHLFGHELVLLVDGDLRQSRVCKSPDEVLYDAGVVAGRDVSERLAAAGARTLNARHLPVVSKGGRSRSCRSALRPSQAPFWKAGRFSRQGVDPARRRLQENPPSPT